MDYGLTNSNELTVKNLDLKHALASGQPLTFLADCDWPKNRFSYVDNGKRTTFKISGNPKNLTMALARGAPNF